MLNDLKHNWLNVPATAIISSSDSTSGKVNHASIDSAEICEEEGLIGRNMFTIDACELKSNASKECGSVGEKQTLQPAVAQLKQQLAKLNTEKMADKHTIKFTADSGFNSEVNLEYMAKSGFDTYIADNQFRKRNPLFKDSETYEIEQESAD